ncbi:SRPBCC domain-containing protein [Humibacter sp. RRB41]|uniref:SRPBCC family protein n=1 Tax=Humibacter sp. RRB41 TaxID=2919946 RepID=UPI001FAA8AEC|nr:SRPBCC domain-containing protein [Humibacter sp. RRB41]
MTVIGSSTDPQLLTMTFVAEFVAPPARVWQVWEDPRQLERWWGPPTWPATFDRHELVAGGESRYHMTGPDGEKAPGWWTTLETDAPNSLLIEDGFSLADGEPDPAMPTMRLEVSFQALADGDSTRMTITARFADLQQLEKVAAMGMLEGMTGALTQIDALLD